jgi:RNA polymerase sigma-70 factor (ECF subfamily)
MADQTDMPSDEDLLSRVVGGDLDALGTLYRRHFDWVRSLCLSLTTDAAAADDLSQECFLRVFRYGRSFDSRARFTTWLNRVVRNLCYDFLYQKRIDSRQKDLLRQPSRTLRLEVEEQDHRLEIVRDALSLLPPKKREVLVLSRLQGLKYREIAEICGISEDAVKARAHRALRELREIYTNLESVQ